MSKLPLSMCHDLALLLMRVMAGVVFAFHGSQKVFGWFGGHGMEGFTQFVASLEVPMPEVSAWLAAGSELLGGVALLLGFGQRLLSIPLTITMLVACTAHSGFSGENGMEYPLTLAVFAAGLGLLGPGRFSLAAQLGGGKSEG